jgi:lipopolysaccharide transport system ATP-binding protein
MPGRAVVVVENLSKKYLVGHKSVQQAIRKDTLRDVIGREVRDFARKALDVTRGRQIVQGDEIEEFWALRNVSFELREGEILGIVGRNGAGKSTLLKLLSRITEPTEGRIILRGRVSSLLEVGTGFHQELTGRENVFLNGAILGMTQREIRNKFDEIVAFAEVDKFLDTPVKRYSSGMYVRLAFAVAAHLEPEILIVDEVLAVGDAEFQKKCLGKISQVARGGRTVLFVSHNHAAVRSLCTHALVLRSGCASPKQDVSSALDQYSFAFPLKTTSSWARPAELQKGAVSFETIEAHIDGAQPRIRLLCSVSISSTLGSKPVFIAVDVVDRNSVVLMQALPRCEPFIGGGSGSHAVELSIDLPPLIPGLYNLDFWIGSHFTETSDHIKQAVMFEILESPSPGRAFPHTSEHGYVVPSSNARVRARRSSPNAIPMDVKC